MGLSRPGRKSNAQRATNMKLTIQHRHLRSTHALDSLVEERIIALQPRLQIDEANVRLECCPDSSPAFRAHIHLVTPGPDLAAEGRDHTIRAAIDRVLAELEDKLQERRRQRVRRLRSNQQSPAALRSGRGRR